jgi:hypothetical protein
MTLKKVILPIIKRVILGYYYAEMVNGEARSVLEVSMADGLMHNLETSFPGCFKELNKAEYDNALAFGVPQSQIELGTNHVTVLLKGERHVKVVVEKVRVGDGPHEIHVPLGKILKEDQELKKKGGI